MANEKTTNNQPRPFSDGMLAGIPIALGYFAVSFAFGLAAREGGLSVFQATLLSLVNVTSAGQFAGLNVIIANGSLAEIALTQLVINLRYALMSFSLSQHLEKTSLFGRMLVAFGVTDEIFAVSHAACGEGKGKLSPYFPYGAMIVAIPGWVAGTFTGAMAGEILPDILLRALSVALYGMFVAIIVPPAKTDRTVLYVIIAAMALSALFSYVPLLKGIPAGFTVIIVTLTVAAAAAYLSVRKDGKKEEAA